MRVDLPHLVPVAVRGRDAQTFLQNQLTCDVRDVGPARAIPGALCTNKGRVVAFFELLPWPDGYLLLLDASVATAVVRHLQAMVFRSKVAVEEFSHELRVTDVLGEERFDGPEESRACAARDGGLVMRSSGAPPRWIVVAPVSAPGNGAVPDRSAWELAEIEAEIPLVEARTSEAFLPQFLNLDQAGGLSFRKGCYPGQEIVARTQHLGEVKRRMCRAHCDAPAAPAPGSPLRAVQPDGSERDGGTVVRSARAPEGGAWLLAVVPVAELEAGHPIHLGSAAGPRLVFD